MIPPRPFVYYTDKQRGFSECFACGNWRRNMMFHHEGQHFILCRIDYADYWENTDVLLPDYKEYL